MKLSYTILIILQYFTLLSSGLPLHENRHELRDDTLLDDISSVANVCLEQRKNTKGFGKVSLKNAKGNSCINAKGVGSVFNYTDGQSTTELVTQTVSLLFCLFFFFECPRLHDFMIAV